MPDSFTGALFPLDISYGSVFKPTYSTTTGVSLSGYETANPNWSNTRLFSDIRYGVRRQSQLDNLIEFFHAHEGSAFSFLVRDHSDYRSVGAADPNTISFLDQTLLASAVGGETQIQTIKNYTRGSKTTSRDIYKIDLSDVDYLLAINGVEKFSPADFTVDETSGLVTLSTPLVAGDTVTAGYHFYLEMKFEKDEIPISLDFYQGGGSAVMLAEKRFTSST